MNKILLEEIPEVCGGGQLHQDHQGAAHQEDPPQPLQPAAGTLHPTQENTLVHSPTLLLVLFVKITVIHLK